MLEKINGFIWGYGLIFLLLATGIAYTFKLRFIQFRLFSFLFSSTRKNENKGLSQFKTVCMSLGTAMGTGNITGVASAVAIGGAGAVFWLWVSAFFGMALVYAENSLSVMYSNGISRGPMAYLEKGLGNRVSACIFATFCILASFGMGGAVQINTFAESLYMCTDINKYIPAVIIFIILFFTIKGGAERIGSLSQILLPTASIAYIVLSVAVIYRFRGNIPEVFRNIFAEAFGTRQISGGIFGFTVSEALSAGIRRGIFSNEAGLGSSPILHSSAESDSPHLQGMWSMFEVFFDTFVCCTLTALVILCSAPDFSVNTAFSSVTGNKSGIFLTAETAVFSFCTVIGWYYCGETAFIYIFGEKYKKIMCIVFAVISASGALLKLETVWTLSDIFNGLMAFPNLLGLILLMNKVKKE